MRVEVPAVTETRSALDRLVGVGAHPDRRVRVLLQRHGDARLVELEMRTLHGHGSAGPELLHRVQVFLEAANGALALDAEALELDIPVAERAAEDHLAA